ncbi:OmpA family protein [Moraxella catarrhalis]|nr:OmpA family protein [Moraxella catarrhalis]EGE26204.1 outer membrane protein CD [Moraxella catarrhalis CO72]MPW56945.1 OmpA family protein [Moraxella catarrhalis]MPW60902.1 OmpA family protein [Moraxella catarrhalis]MPW87535.1 OmpA family protein [Moraxella catarrhalis]MPX09097.1 OmpA family protein [Moraxella catarrhalis]
MKFNKIALAVIAAVAAPVAAPVAAQAGVTVSPLLLGYHYTDEAHNDQRKILRTGKKLELDATNAPAPANGGVALDSELWTGAAIGIELTPSTQFQVEYGISNRDAKSSDKSAHRFDAEQETISGNFLIGTEQFSGYNPTNKFKPYVLVGAGQSKIKVNAIDGYTAEVANGQNIAEKQVVKAGQEVAESKDTIGNLGLGARYLVNDALALRGEARAIHNFDNKWWEGLALAGLEVTLGGRLAPAVPVAPVAEPVAEPVVAPAPVILPKPEPEPVIEEAPAVIEDIVVDSDGDGVPDHLDACPGTPVNAVVDPRGCPVQVNLVEELRQELRVFFDYDKSIIKPQYREEVAKVAAQMREFPNATATIEGHASRDSARSSARYNQRLSEARANAVKSMLSNEFGIAPNRLNAVGYGFDRPIAPNTTAEGKAMNRRVEAVITGSKTTTVDQTKDMIVQ